jgi:hypothetical protein
MPKLTEIKHSELDGSKRFFSQGIILDHYEFSEIHMRIEKFMSLSLKYPPHSYVRMETRPEPFPCGIPEFLRNPDAIRSSRFSSKVVMDSSLQADDPRSHRYQDNSAEYTSYYEHNTFTVSVSYSVNPLSDSPLKMYLSIKPIHLEETDETRQEMEIIRNQPFANLLNIIVDYGNDFDEFYYKNDQELHDEEMRDVAYDIIESREHGY